MDAESNDNTGARDTGTSASEGRLKLMLSKRHSKKMKKKGFFGKGGPKEGSKEEEKGESKAEKKAERAGEYDGKGGPVTNMAKFTDIDASKKFKKSDNYGR